MNQSSQLSPQARRALTREYKQAFPPLGIYAVRCEAAGLLRLGASRNVDGMLNRIRFQLTSGGMRDAQLTQAWAQHGPQAVAVLQRVAAAMVKGCAAHKKTVTGGLINQVIQPVKGGRRVDRCTPHVNPRWVVLSVVHLKAPFHKK